VNWSGDMMIVVQRMMSFLEDERFLSAQRDAAETEQERTLSWRLPTICWAATQALGLKGDFVQCGVGRGYVGAMVARYLGDAVLAQRKWHLFDDFAALPDYTPTYTILGSKKPLGNYRAAKARLARFPSITVFDGKLPDVLGKRAMRKIAFLHLDLSDAATEVAVLDRLYDRLVPGAPIVLEKYGWLVAKAQHDAMKAYCAERGMPVLELAIGQGLAIKR
jgi:O-methyltransferase